MRASELDIALARYDVRTLRELGCPCADVVFSGHVLSNHAIDDQDSVTGIASTFLKDPESINCPVASSPSNYYIAGIALLNAFLRVNFAGPPDANESRKDFQRAEDSTHLSIDGEDAPSNILRPSLLIAAKSILVEYAAVFVEAGFAFAPWWAARASLAHHLVLNRPTPTLQVSIFENFVAILGSSCSGVGTLKKLKLVQICDESPTSTELLSRDSVFQDLATQDLAALAHLELCSAQQYFFDVEGAMQSLQCACAYLDIEVEVQGTLGIRTKHQQTPVSQLVARVFSTASGSPRKPHHVFCSAFPRAAPSSSSVDDTDNSKQRGSPGVETSPDSVSTLPVPTNCSLNDPDVLGYVKFVPSQNDEDGVHGSKNDKIVSATEAEVENLTPMEQCLVLAHANVELSRNSQHILTDEQVAPFVHKVLNSVQSAFGTSSVVQVHALIMRSGFEHDKGRYLERTMAQLEAVANFIDCDMKMYNRSDIFSAATERNALVLACHLAPRWEIKKALAAALGRLGLVKSAMKIYEDLECWDELVDCHRLVGNLGAAESLIKDELQKLDDAASNSKLQTDEVGGTSVSSLQETSKAYNEALRRRSRRRPRLLCILGDVTRDIKFYNQAWSESQGQSARAKRSLGRVAFVNGLWNEALDHYREALSLNPLFPEIWFACGCAAMEVKDMNYAALCFTRTVQESPRNGEAWNNLGRVLSELGKDKESLSALVEASKYKRDSWRIWDNILIVATKVQSSKYIVRAVDRLMDLRGKEGVASSAIEVAVEHVLQSKVANTPADQSAESTTASRADANQNCRSLLQVLARATSLISSDPKLWAVYAKLQAIVPGKDSLRKSAEFRQRQIRAQILQSDWKSEVPAFRAMTAASLDFAKTALKSEDSGIIHAAILHLNNIILQTREDFEEDEGFSNLLEGLSMLRLNTTA